jgi:hypothetical protein
LGRVLDVDGAAVAVVSSYTFSLATNELLRAAPDSELLLIVSVIRRSPHLLAVLPVQIFLRAQELLQQLPIDALDIPGVLKANAEEPEPVESEGSLGLRPLLFTNLGILDLDSHVFGFRDLENPLR